VTLTPAGYGYFAAEALDWPEVVEMLQASGKPWNEGAIRTDLRWLDDQVRRGRIRKIPNSKALAQRYNRTEWFVRNLLSNEPWWKDQYYDEDRRENSAKIPRNGREDSANPETEERQESTESRESAAKSPRKLREDSATRAVDPPITDHQHDRSPAPNPRPSGPGALTEAAEWIANRAIRQLDAIKADGEDIETALERYEQAPADVIDNWREFMRGTTATGVDGRSRRKRPEQGIPEGIRRRDIVAGLQEGARRFRARARDRPHEDDEAA
jgi:hypothetical protein